MRKLIGFAVFGLMLSAAVPAQASVFVWQDPKNDFSMSFPDTWRIQTEDTPTTRLRIAGPLGEDAPTCRMQVDDDGRAKIYPKRLTDEAVTELLDENFWKAHVGQYKMSSIAEYYAPASLGGKGDATAVKFGFVDNKNVPMYGVMIGSVYGGKKFIASCSAKADIYDRWSDVFASIIDSVELKSKYHPFPQGYYRDFLADPDLVLPRVKPGTVSKNSFWWNEGSYHRTYFNYNR